MIRAQSSFAASKSEQVPETMAASFSCCSSALFQPVWLPGIPIDFKAHVCSQGPVLGGNPYADVTKRERLDASLEVKVTGTIVRPTFLRLAWGRSNRSVATQA